MRPTTQHADAPNTDTQAPPDGVAPVSSVHWLGCHGGAGTTTLAHVTGIGHDAGRIVPPVEPGTAVLLVARGSSNGLNQAAIALRYLRATPSPPVMGLVVVAASAAKPSLLVRQRIEAVGQWVPLVHKVAWVEEFVAAAHPDQVGVPPSIASLTAYLDARLSGEADRPAAVGGVR